MHTVPYITWKIIARMGMILKTHSWWWWGLSLSNTQFIEHFLVSYSNISLRNTTINLMWGSCCSNGKIKAQWRIFYRLNRIGWFCLGMADMLASPSSALCMRLWTRPALVQIMDWWLVVMPTTTYVRPPILSPIKYMVFMQMCANWSAN